MTKGMKQFLLKRLQEEGSLEYTKGMLDGLHVELKDELTRVEEKTGEKNWILRLLLHRLKI